MAVDDTQARILSEIRSVKAMVLNQAKTLKGHDGRLHDLEEANRVIQIAKQAIDEYKKSEAAEQRQKVRDDYSSTKLKLLRDLSPLIVAAIALAYALLTRHP